jgi:hypothetical protein
MQRIARRQGASICRNLQLGPHQHHVAHVNRHRRHREDDHHQNGRHHQHGATTVFRRLFERHGSFGGQRPWGLAEVFQFQLMDFRHESGWLKANLSP